MRLRTAFSALALTAWATAVTLGAVTASASIAGTGQSGNLPGPFLRFAHGARPRAGPAPTLSTASKSAPPLLGPAPVRVWVPGFFSWALLDRSTGAMYGSANSADTTTSTESMIKIWIASDDLRRLPPDGAPDQYRLDELSRMIRDSDDSAAEDIYQQNGADSVVQRMISMCDLAETSIAEGWWSRTEVSARDAVRLGICITDGRAAGPKWTSWVLGEMRQVRGDGRFGIVDALPTPVATHIPIKNGWTVVGAEWRVNCLAVVDEYVLAVLTRYPEGLGLAYGADICRSVTAQLRTPAR
ncbi:hypothetical protein HC028_25535 [Planosporangium flavigriseum]|uniref:Beta-lactamase enzyme family protein n=1 Tax=Planosporangium flavigriseum TaxID=373681 RepID=A0A8J3LQV9_9ACTN|nr:hypothetical protein [Planosporangium flavigriseum]NJC67841.1 hypothetical protein [Planosporangium flavigriseum]GIG76342.1 hypothetical protein Pfl04_47460 [Planosporangium flavigriseum]